jgi:stage II sporulation protein D (peptidoglycan lytic transglycosylase)
LSGARRFAALLAVTLVLAACTEPTPSAPPPAPTSGSVSPPESPSIGARRIELTPPPDGTFLVRGAYPRIRSRCKDPERPTLEARYPGTLTVRRSDDGTLAITVTLPFERYLEGIAEVPPSWPRAALEAQAIAARSFALASTGWDGAQGDTLDTPICATTACQVYRGIPVSRLPGLGRWYRAVRRTAGRVLLYQGRPAETVYSSTSNGRTYGNEEVFGSAPLPYLRPVPERDDGASPTSRWRVALPFGHVARFLGRADQWSAGRAISSVRLEGSTVVVSAGKRSRTLDLSTFRDAVNTWAPCLAPARYPPGRLPLTIPSRWLTISERDGDVVVTGRGWGHGVGMVQWGAYGKARRGFSAARILAFYYGGLRPRAHPEPGLIHVEVASGLTRLGIEPSAEGAELDGRPIALEALHVTGRGELTVRS